MKAQLLTLSFWKLSAIIKFDRRQVTNILSEEFPARLRIAIVEVVKDTFGQLSKKNLSKTRYLKKIEVKKYVGGVNDQGFEKLIVHGLKEIRVSGFLRYGKKDVDGLVAKYEIQRRSIWESLVEH